MRPRLQILKTWHKIEPTKVVGLRGEGTSLSEIELADGHMSFAEALYIAPAIGSIVP